MLLKEWLDKKGLTQDQFAVQCGFSKGAVAKWVSGERFPRLEAMQKIEKITDGSVTVQDFFNQAKQVQR